MIYPLHNMHRLDFMYPVTGLKIIMWSCDNNHKVWHLLLQDVQSNMIRTADGPIMVFNRLTSLLSCAEVTSFYH